MMVVLLDSLVLSFLVCQQMFIVVYSSNTQQDNA